MSTSKETQITKSAGLVSFLLLFVVFVLFAYFRFYNLDQRISFDWDQQSYSFDVKRIIVDHDPVLIGPRVMDDRGFFLGPYFTYILVPFFFFTNTHPIAFLPFIVVVNILFFTVSYLAIKKMFDVKTALLFLLFWSINPLLVTYDIVPWNPVFIPIGMILTWYLLWNVYKKQSPMNYLLLGASLGFFIHMHFQFVFMLLFSIIFLLKMYAEKKKSFHMKHVSLTLLPFAASFLPLLLFDMKHEFLNSKLFISFFTERLGEGTRDLQVWREVFGIFLRPILIQPNDILVFIFYIAVLGILVFLWKKTIAFHKIFYFSTIFVWIATFIVFTIYAHRPSEYYFMYLYPFIFIAFANIVTMYKKEYIGVAIAILLLLLNWADLTRLTDGKIFSLYFKDQAVRQILPYVNDKKYNVSMDMPLGTNSGYEYLLEYYNIVSTGDPNDPLIQLRVPSQDGDIKIRDIGVAIPEELK